MRPADARAPPECLLAQTLLSVILLDARAPSPPLRTPYDARNDGGESPPVRTPSLFIRSDSLCGPSPSSVQVSSCVSCPQLSSHCCFPPWYRGPGGELITTCTGCRHPELPTRSRDLPASWYMGSVFFGGGGVRLLFHCWIITCLFSHLTVINYKIFGKIKEKNMLCDSSLRIVFDNV